MLLTKILLLFGLFYLVNPALTFAQTPQPEEKLEGTIIQILEERKIQVFDKEQAVQKLDINITSGSKSGTNLIIENGTLPTIQTVKYKPNDKVVITASKDLTGNDIYLISDYVRRDALAFLALIFAGLVVLITGKKGIKALFGLAVSFLVIFTVILPNLLAGKDPVLTAITGCLIIVPITFYLSHGINRKTHIAVLSTLIALGITGVLANYFVDLAHLTGYAAEEASFIQYAQQGTLNIQGILLAGIIIGVVGILDDITISQSAVVFELKHASPSLKFAELYKKAMNVGKDHIASVVNTLVIVYAGAALPLLMLFVVNPQPFSAVINQEMVAEEVVRTLIASIGLILAVPLATVLAAWTTEI